MLDRSSTTAKMILWFAGVLLLVVFLYAVGMPTTKKMNFAMMASFAGTVMTLAMGFVFPSRFSAALAHVVQLIWMGLVFVGGFAIGIIMVCFITKTNLPFVTTQWYGVFIALSIFGGAFTTHLEKSRLEIIEEWKQVDFQKAEVFSGDSTASSSSSSA